MFWEFSYAYVQLHVALIDFNGLINRCLDGIQLWSVEEIKRTTWKDFVRIFICTAKSSFSDKKRDIGKR